MPRRRYCRVSDEDWEWIIARYEIGEDFLNTADELQIPRTTAYKIIRKFIMTGGGRSPSLDDEAKDFLVMLLEGTPPLTLDEFNSSLHETFPRKPRVCNMTISRSLDGEIITLKKSRNAVVNRNLEEVKNARVAHTQYLYEEGIHRHRVYVDEPGYNLYTSRMYGQAPCGQRATRVVAGQRRNNVSLIAAISNQAGLFYYEIHTQSVTM